MEQNDNFAQNQILTCCNFVPIASLYYSKPQRPALRVFRSNMIKRILKRKLFLDMEPSVHQFLVTIPKYEINFQFPFIEHIKISIKSDT